MAEELSKSAKKRAAKKARDEGFDAGQGAAAPNKENSSKAANAKAAPSPEPPKPKAKAKAKAEPEPKAKAQAEPEPKAKAKAKAKAEPEPKSKAKAKAEPKKEEVKPAPKTESKAKAAPKAAQPAAKGGAKAKAQPVKEEPVKEKTEVTQPFEMDDGSGGWEQSTGLSKKAQNRQQKALEIQAQGSQVKNQKVVPGLGPSDQNIPGMAPKLNQAEVNAVLKSAAAAGAAARAAIEAQAAEEKQKESNQSTATIKVPEAKIGIVIGPKGSKIKLIQEKTGVTRIDTSGEVFTIMGEPAAVASAEKAIKELIEKGYCAMAFDNFKEEQVAVHPGCFPDLIGKQGAVIKAMKSELGVEVGMPETPKTPPAGKKYKVTIAGKTENVEKAKEVIDHIVAYGYHEITHPGFSHEEVEVPGWAYSFLIGKAGSELRHIQNNYKVKVNIPREHSVCQEVVVVGEKHDVDRAKAYIEKLLWNAENQSKGRSKADGAIDTWGDDKEEEEDWMKAYLYKR